MKTLLTSIMIIGLAASSVPRSDAHHAFASVFDGDDPLSLTGTVTKVEWMNPHTWFFIDVETKAGEVENWGFEMGSPNALIRRGWSRDTLQIGQLIKVIGVRARDGSMRGAVRTVSLANGERLFGAQDESR